MNTIDYMAPILERDKSKKNGKITVKISKELASLAKNMKLSEIAKCSIPIVDEFSEKKKPENKYLFCKLPRCILFFLQFIDFASLLPVQR